MTSDDESKEAALREVLSRAERELGGSFAESTVEPADPDYEQFEPWMADWWRAHEQMPATLDLRCGIDGCRSMVGEIKADGDIAIALMYSRFGESTVEPPSRITEEDLGFPPGTVLRDASGATLSEIEQRRFDEFAKKIIPRPVGDGRYLTKRETATPRLMRVEDIALIGFITCRRHGVVSLSDPDATIADMRAVLSNVTHARKSDYMMFRGNSVS